MDSIEEMNRGFLALKCQSAENFHEAFPMCREFKKSTVSDNYKAWKLLREKDPENLRRAVEGKGPWEGKRWTDLRRHARKLV